MGKNSKKKKQRTNYKRHNNNIIMEILIIKQKKGRCAQSGHIKKRDKDIQLTSSPHYPEVRLKLKQRAVNILI